MMDVQPLGLFQHLYATTKPAHRALERNLDLLGKAITAARIERALGKFLGFHRVWETGFANSDMFAQVIRNRGSARCAASDLEALGVAREEIARIPLCAAWSELKNWAEKRFEHATWGLIEQGARKPSH